MSDILPFERFFSFEESNFLKEAFVRAVETFEEAGYRYLRVPVFDRFVALEKILSSEARKSIVFKDLSKGELVALRPDFTSFVIRALGTMKVVDFPTKVYYFGTVFRTVQGSWEDVQAGVEIIGEKDTKADAEVIVVLWRYLKNLGFENVSVSIGHVKVVEKIVKSFPEEERDKVKEAFREKNLSVLKGIFKGSYFLEIPFVSDAQKVYEILKDLGFVEEVEEIREVADILSEEGVPFSLDIFEVRDLPYYTGIVFDFFLPGIGSPVAGGGRYDAMAEAVGLSQPAVGGTVYLSRLLK